MPFQSVFALECCFRCVYIRAVRGNWFCIPKQNCEREEHRRWNANTFSGSYHVQCSVHSYNVHTQLSLYAHAHVNKSDRERERSSPTHSMCAVSTVYTNCDDRVHGKGECQRENEQNTWKAFGSSSFLFDLYTITTELFIFWARMFGFGFADVVCPCNQAKHVNIFQFSTHQHIHI